MQQQAEAASGVSEGEKPTDDELAKNEKAVTPNEADKTEEDDDAPKESSDKEEEDDEDDTDTTMSDDSDADLKEDPEVLLIKATTLKDEGNNHFKNKDFEKAARAYRRGTSALKPLNKQNTGDEQVKSLLVSLQTNLSMMCFKQEKYRQSSQVATQVLQIDKSNVKALYRRAVANRKMGEVEQARSDLREAYKQDPNNAAVKKELASLKKQIEDSKQAQKKSLQRAFSKGGGASLYDDKEQAKKRKEEQERLTKKQEEEKLKKRKADWEDECVKRMAKGEEAISFEDWEKELKSKEEAVAKKKKEEEEKKKEERRKAREAARKAEAANKKDDDSDDDELTEKELAQLRGYKKTSDGRTTSYFTREQSHHEKSLIGDITPKRLESPTDASAPKPITEAEASTGNSASKWNHAGTWEEKDTTEWCRERLISRLKETKSEAGSLVGIITEVQDMTGDASVAMVSGKKRYIFDFHCKVQFEVKDPDTDDVFAKGSLKLPDICSTHHEELEVNFTGWKKSPSEEHRQAATDCVPALTSEVRESVKLWVTDFNNTY